MRRLLALSTILAAIAASCREPQGSDAPAGPDSGKGGMADAAADGGDAEPLPGPPPRPPNPFEGALAPVQRGEYLVRHVAACVECHSPRLPDGAFDEELLLSGVESLLDLVPDDDAMGAIHAPNLTPHADTGLGEWTDREVKNAIRNGVARGGRPLHPAMPYAAFHSMTEEDADAVVAYLRSIPPVDRAIPERQPLPEELVEPARPVAADAIPDPGLPPEDPRYERAGRGRYLASLACLRCHSPDSEEGPVPFDVERLFMGGRSMPPFPLGSPPLEDPPLIESPNLTPHETGLAEWTPEEVRRAIKNGLTYDGLPICPPMPVGPSGSFALITDEDALDIAQYLLSLEPRDSPRVGDCCAACHDESGNVTRPGLNPLGGVAAGESTAAHPVRCSAGCGGRQ